MKKTSWINLLLSLVSGANRLRSVYVRHHKRRLITDYFIYKRLFDFITTKLWIDDNKYRIES